MRSWCVCGGLLNGLDQDFDLCFGSLLWWHSILSWSSQLKLWALMVLGGQKWSERLGVCDPRVRGALLFRCMVAGLCWHFSHFPWLCKVFLQTFLHFASQFCNLKTILMLGGDFAAISKLKNDFAAQNWFRSPFHSFEMRGTVLQMALMCQKVVSHLRNTLPNGVSAAKFPLSFARSSSNGHNFFVSTPNRVLFEALDF